MIVKNKEETVAEHCSFFYFISGIFIFYLILYACLQCFDTVGWAAGRASGL